MTTGWLKGRRGSFQGWYSAPRQCTAGGAMQRCQILVNYSLRLEKLYNVLKLHPRTTHFGKAYVGRCSYSCVRDYQVAKLKTGLQTPGSCGSHKFLTG
jgi:hypothetical protein